jgi:hypothetical protein
MNDQIMRAAQDAGVIAVEHRIETTYSDDRTPYTFTRSHNVVGAAQCRLCNDVARGMEILATEGEFTDGPHD